MPARAPASLATLSLALASHLCCALSLNHDKGFLCVRDGLFPDYETECREYVRCTGGEVKRRYACPAGRAFDTVAAACVPRHRQPCVRRGCARGDTLAYATPGTACRQYYRCENGSAVDHVCPSGAWFDLERQACSRGAGTCYEPLCAGLPDGDYPDSSHECRRVLHCRGARLRAVTSCVGLCAPADSCPPPRTASVPLPAGDADFCSDEACSSLCQDVEDGAYADRVAGCHEYFVCEERRVTRRGVCEPGLLFAGGGCEPASRALCPPPARSSCFNRVDGLHRDWRDCSSWYECRRERVVARGTCDAGQVFDGAVCMAASEFECSGPEPAKACAGKPSGIYQDLESNCTRYFHCEGVRRIMLSCGAGRVYDGARCVDADSYLCPSLDRESCYGRADGRYRARDAGCRGYYVCAGGERAAYACAAGYMFSGDTCVRAPPHGCPDEDYSCSGLADGYHAEIDSNCQRYFYCEGGDRLATLSCSGGKIFDGRACVEPFLHECGAPPKNSIENDNCERDGFYIQQGTECKRYYFCVTGAKTSLSCPTGQIFNGQICVAKTQFTCPG